MCNAHPYFSSKIWAKKCALYTAKYGTCQASVPTEEELDMDRNCRGEYL